MDRDTKNKVGATVIVIVFLLIGWIIQKMTPASYYGPDADDLEQPLPRIGN